MEDGEGNIMVSNTPPLSTSMPRSSIHTQGEGRKLGGKEERGERRRRKKKHMFCSSQ